MPLYEYECGCGNRFEALRSIEDRHKVVCGCGRVPKLRIGSVSYRIAETFSVLAGDGTLISQTQTAERIPYGYQTLDGAERRL